MIHVKKKTRDDGSPAESNESMMRRFQRKAIVIYKQTKGKDFFTKKKNRSTRRDDAVRRERVREKYAHDVRTGKIKEDQYGRSTRKRGGKKRG